MDTIEKVKTILGFTDNSKDSLLASIQSVIEARLKMKLGNVSEVPSELDYILVEATISRFNRINDEGKKSASESDVSATYETDDLAPFADDIQEWIDNHRDTTKGKFVMF
ncbi:hypothetical protein CYR79_09805 [Ligilactobacillus agilis]|uniref:Phage head-tail connector protein n=1 Tax=Ligilactobacillus agilis TaxID=1601 RepID=A0A2I2A8Q2_9LACO|nr:phage head-tail connector protein [Ligilactobacillus agilis]PLA75770.1 hypothetical protein CYR79_09805 [Ligilactobacillus agilis]